MLEVCALLNLLMLGFLLCHRTHRMNLRCPGGAPLRLRDDAGKLGDGDLLFFHANAVSSSLVTCWTHVALVHRPPNGRILLYEVTPSSMCPTLRPVRAAVRACLGGHRTNRVAWRRRRRRHGEPAPAVARGITATRHLSYRHYWWMIMLRRCWPGLSLPEGGTTSATFCCDLVLRVLGDDDEGHSWLPDDMARAWPARYDPLVEVVP